MTLYHASQYDRSRLAGSWWEEEAPPLSFTPERLDGDVACDFAVVGGGYTGLGAAEALARDHGAGVVLCEAGPLAWGASGRAGGFCCLHPSTHSPSTLLTRHGREDVRAYFAWLLDGMARIDALSKTEGVDIGRAGDGILEIADSERLLEELSEEVEAYETAGVSVELLGAEALEERFMKAARFTGALHIKAGFGLQPLRYARALAALANQAGARLFERTPVVGLSREGGHIFVETPTGRVRAGKVLIATNGYADPVLHERLERSLMPIISSIIVTRPLSEEERAAHRYGSETPASTVRALLHYFRLLPDGRFLFGARGDSSGTPEAAAARRRRLEAELGEMFPAWAGVEITHAWGGLVCFTLNGLPALGPLGDEDKVWSAAAYHGNGIAAAAAAGRSAASMMIGGEQVRASVPALLRGRPPAIPFPSLRRWYLRAAVAYYRLAERH